MVFNFYNKTTKNSLYLGILLLIIFAILLFCSYPTVFSDQNVSYYVYSTVVQGFLALIGFLGAVSVFKLQLIENEAQKISAGLEDTVKMYKGVEVHSYSWIEMMNVCEEIIQDKNSQWQLQQIKSGCDKLFKLRDEKSPVRNSMIDLSLISMINIILALFGMPLSRLFIVENLFFINYIYMMVIFTLSIYSAINAVQVIRYCVGYSFSIKL
jgi:hypothetical protein